MFSNFLSKDAKNPPELERRHVFNAEDEVFFHRLQQALPNCHVFPKLALSHLIEVKDSNEKKRNLFREKLERREVDFGVFNAKLKLLFVVLLEDDAPASVEDEYPSRKLLKRARIKSIRWSRASLPSFEQILRTVEQFSELEAPRSDYPLPSIGKLFADDEIIDGQIFSKVENSNSKALSLAAIERIASEQLIKTQYPHIWQKICLFSGDPDYLKSYLESLFIQNRPNKRRGLPKPVADEVIQIQNENARFVISKEAAPIWDPNFLHR